jgi:hypothetical protein
VSISTKSIVILNLTEDREPIPIRGVELVGNLKTISEKWPLPQKCYTTLAPILSLAYQTKLGIKAHKLSSMTPIFLPRY